MRQRMSGVMSARANKMINELYMSDNGKMQGTDNGSITYGMNSLTGSTIDHEEFNTRASLNRTFTCTRKTKNGYNDKILISDKKKPYAISPRVGNTFVMGYPKMKKKPLEYRYFPYLKKPADKFSV
jgi:hypothetical protein